MVKYCLCVWLSLSVLQAYPQQTVQFSQYVFNGLAVNPAYAGYKDEWTANLSYRMQWTGIDGAPQTGTVSLDGLGNGRSKNIGLGIIATTDRIGPLSTSSAHANYAYRLRLDNDDTKRICFGIAFGAVQYKLDASKFNPSDPLDYSIPTGDEVRLSPDLRFGIYYYSPQFYVGASVLNVLQGAASTGQNGTKLISPIRHIYLTGGGMLPLTESLDLKPSFLLKEDFKGPTNLDLTNYLLINRKIWLGASWRTGVNFWKKPNLPKGLKQGDALAALMQLYVNDRFRVGYSFDFTISKLSAYQNGSHEISIGLSLRKKGERVLSPRFF